MLLYLSAFVVVVIKMALGDVLSLAQGKIRGIVKDGYTSYLGIPYADASSADGRFKRATTAPRWPNIRESSSPHPCYSSSSIEPCLQLDVHVPIGSVAAPWPVLVWVKSGTGKYHPGRMVKEGVIVVDVNYRVGPIGFLCLDDERIPGNSGAKDVVIALRWVRDNIVAFHGSPAKVVVAGQGYGAALVDALTISAMADNLFHGVIIQGGSALSPCTFNYDTLARAKMLIKEITISASKDVWISALLNANFGDLMIKSEMLDHPYFPFGMCVEKAYRKEERFLSESPFDLLTNGKMYKVPMIIGFNNDEAFIFASILKQSKALRRISKDVTFLLPEELIFLNENEIIKVAKQIKDLYFANNLTMAALLTYHRDVYFLSHIYRSARYHAEVSPVYLYQFSYSGDLGVQAQHDHEKMGAAHSDELAYLFPDGGRTLDGDEGMVQDRLVKLWTNFVKYLNPTPAAQGDLTRWDALNPGDPRMLDVGLRAEMKAFPYSKAAQLWDAVYEKHFYKRWQNRLT